MAMKKYIESMKHPMKEAWTTFADMHGWSYSSEEWIDDALAGEIAGHPAAFSLHTSGVTGDKSYFTVLVASCSFLQATDMKIQHYNLPTRFFVRLFRGEDIKTGDREFDTIRRVTGKPAEMIRLFCSDWTTRQRLAKINHFNFSSLHLDSEAQRVRLSARSYVKEEPALLEMIDIVRSSLSRLADLHIIAPLPQQLTSEQWTD